MDFSYGNMIEVYVKYATSSELEANQSIYTTVKDGKVQKNNQT
jgi:hypothetical protein